MSGQQRDLSCDVLVVGSGAGGLSTAITARKSGLDVIIIEKDQYFGGTTAFSGGVLWVPGNKHAREAGVSDNREAARIYLKHETGNHFGDAAIDAFLDVGPRMLDFFEKETEAKFVLSAYPDYHPGVEGGATSGRSVTAAPYDARALGEESIGTQGTPVQVLGKLIAQRQLPKLWEVRSRLVELFDAERKGSAA